MKSWTITESTEIGLRIDVFLTDHTDLSRSKVATLIKEGGVLCNGEAVKANYKLHHGDVITAQDYEVKPLAIEGIAMPLDIVYEDESLCVINKPQGIVVHPGKGTHEPTLLHGLIAHFNQGTGPYIKPGLVHRIDKDTAGLLVVAKNDTVHAFLAEQLLDKTMSRTYYALVHGNLAQDCIIDAPIAPSAGAHMIISNKNGKRAETHVKVIQHFHNHTLVECDLKTGRTHQIRVHMKHIGHPLVHDPLYGIDENPQGQYLFAHTLQFIHPKTHQLAVYTAPLPAHFQKLIALLENGGSL